MAGGKLILQSRKGKGRVPKATKAYVDKAIKRNRPTKVTYEDGGAVEVTDTVDFINLSDGISQGAGGEGNRSGDNIRYKSIRGHVYAKREAASTTGTADAQRYVIFQWKPDNVDDAPTSLNDIFESTTRHYLSEFVTNKALRAKFTVLWDSGPFVLHSELDSLPFTKIFKNIRIKKPPMQTHFTTGATTGAGFIYMVTIGSYSSASTDHTDISYRFALRYSDA